jgi:hypothetical protein
LRVSNAAPEALSKNLLISANPIFVGHEVWHEPCSLVATHSPVV